MEQPRILFIVCDTLKADHLGCYGYFRETSLNIDRIAREGVLFEDFYNAGSPTGPGFTCIYTGLHTIHHKYYRFGEPNIRQVDDTIFTMPEVMRALGYTTAGFDNLMNVIHARAKHWARGYEFYVNCGPTAFDLAHHLKAEQLNRRLIPWVKTYAHEKFFLFVHYWDPHTPYNQPEEYKNRFKHETGSISDLEVKEALAGYKYVPGWGATEQIAAEEKKWQGRGLSVDLYDGEIVYMDEAIGQVIEAMENERVLDDTLIVITSDHGEQLGQHNIWGHAALHEAEIHLPLIIRYPKKLEKGKRTAGFCQQIDLLPTMMELVGMSPNTIQVDGTNVMPLLKGKTIREKMFLEHSSGQRSIRTKGWHLLDDEFLDESWIRRPKREPELYNVRDDPMEVINLANTEKEKMEEFRTELHQWVKSNLGEGEADPAIYSDWNETIRKSLEYKDKIKRFLDALGKL